MFKPRATMAVIVLATSLGLSACSMNGMDMGGNTSSPPESSDSVAPFNDQDVNFAMQMVQHHEQAIEMAQLILDKDGIDRRVTELAQNIKDAQGPEIEEMNSWLIGWGGESTSMDGMDMGGDTMSADDMAALESATGVEASRLFLEQMTVHHDGAIAMAEIQLEAGEDVAAVALAQTIIDAQTAEIALMNDILATL